MLQAAVKTQNISRARKKCDLLWENPLGELHPPQSNSNFQILVCVPLIPQHPSGTQRSGDILQYIPVKWQIVTRGHAGHVPLPKRIRRRSQRRKTSWASFTLHSLFSPGTGPGWSSKFAGGTECIAAVGLGGFRSPSRFWNGLRALLRSYPFAWVLKEERTSARSRVQ